MKEFKVENPVTISLGTVEKADRYISIDSEIMPLHNTEVNGEHYGINVIDMYGHLSSYPTQSIVTAIQFSSVNILRVFEEHKSKPWLFMRSGIVDLPAQYCDFDNGDDMKESNDYILKLLRKRIYGEDRK